MRTVFFRIFVCYVCILCVPNVSCIEACVGAHQLDRWDAYPIQRPIAFQVRHVMLQSYTILSDSPTEKLATQANRPSCLSLIGQA
jgi:hypothetical protein